MPKTKTNHYKKKSTPEAEFARYKLEILRAARDLCYGSEILQLIKSATTEGEVTRAMIKGRREMKDLK